MELQKDDIPSLVLGAALLIAGAALLVAHRRIWQRQQADFTYSDSDLEFYGRRRQRRTRAALLLILLGVLIPLGDVVLPFGNRPGLFAIYWMCVIVLTLFLVLIGVSDALATSAYTRRELTRIRHDQRELQQELERYRSQRGDGREH